MVNTDETWYIRTIFLPEQSEMHGSLTHHLVDLATPPESGPDYMITLVQSSEDKAGFITYIQGETLNTHRP